MRSFKLSKILNRDHHRPTLRERAAALRASVAHLKRPTAALPPAAAPETWADPIFVLIDQARSTTRRIDDPYLPYSTYEEAQAEDAECNRRYDAQEEAYRAVFQARPKTRAGLFAQVNYARERFLYLVRLSADASEVNLMPDAPDVLGAIRDGFAMLLDGASGISTPSSLTCEAARLGLAIERLGRESQRLDEEGVSVHDDDAVEPRAADLRKIDAELHATLDIISRVRARSPGGMLAHLAVAFAELDAALGSSPEGDKREGYDRIARCLHSVAAALCAMTGLDRASHGADYLFSTEHDRLADPSEEA